MNLTGLTLEEKRELVALLERKKLLAERNQIYNLYPEKGPLRRELYAKHMEFFDAGAKYRERCMLAGNRIGKSVVGAYETTLHVTGRYPVWWPGRRFEDAIDGWACGKTNETTRDIVQKKLFGAVQSHGDKKSVDGTGLIPYDDIGRITWNRGFPDLIDNAQIKHVGGEWSNISFKTYAQGRGSFEGTAQHWIWLDEEPPADIYGECIIRTATTNGLVAITFTPMEGATEVAMSFMPATMMAELKKRYGA